MAEPVGALAVLGLASNAISIVDFAYKVGKTTYAVANSASNATEEIGAIEELARDYERLSLQGGGIGERPLTAEEAYIEELRLKDKHASKALLDRVEQCRLDGSKRGVKRYLDARIKVTRTVMAKNGMATKQKTLSELNSQLASEDNATDRLHGATCPATLVRQSVPVPALSRKPQSRRPCLHWHPGL